jgi:hypothetical protein
VNGRIAGRGRTTRRTRRLPLAIAWLTTIASLCLHASEPLHAQEDSPPSIEGWLLAGVDATIGTRGRVMASGGYVGGFDSWIVLAEGSFATSAALQLVAGHVLLQPSERDAAITSVLRAGLNWSPVRGRVAIDNRLLIERRSTRGDASPRVRDRLRLSWAIAEASPVRFFAAVEAFAIDRRGLSERRYQAGVAVPVGHASLEAYWLRSAARTRAPFNTIGLTILWRIGPF